MSINSPDKSSLLAFILAKIGLTETDVIWLYQNGVSFQKDSISIRKTLMEDLTIPKTFLQELLILGLDKNEILDLLELTDDKISKTIEHYNLFIPVPSAFSSPTEADVWKGFITQYINPYNSLSFFDKNKEMRAKIMLKLREKNVDYEVIGHLFNYSSRMIREILKEFEEK